MHGYYSQVSHFVVKPGEFTYKEGNSNCNIHFTYSWAFYVRGIYHRQTTLEIATRGEAPICYVLAPLTVVKI